MKSKMKCLLLFLTVMFSLNLAYTQINNPYGVINVAMLDLLYDPPSAKHTREVMQDNELERNIVGENTNIYENPLLLNSEVLDYGTFTLNSRGNLTVVKGKPETEEATPIPFYVYIRRNGKIIENKKMVFLNKQVYKVNLSDIFPFCKHGDMLIIKPARAEDWKAKRVLKLIMEGC